MVRLDHKNYKGKHFQLIQDQRTNKFLILEMIKRVKLENLKIKKQLLLIFTKQLSRRTMLSFEELGI
jgi:uncharacterized ubiquitin-like protein YukD